MDEWGLWGVVIEVYKARRGRVAAVNEFRAKANLVCRDDLPHTLDIAIRDVTLAARCPEGTPLVVVPFDPTVEAEAVPLEAVLHELIDFRGCPVQLDAAFKGFGLIPPTPIDNGSSDATQLDNGPFPLNFLRLVVREAAYSIGSSGGTSDSESEGSYCSTLTSPLAPLPTGADARPRRARGGAARRPAQAKKEPQEAKSRQESHQQPASRRSKRRRRGA